MNSECFKIRRSLSYAPSGAGGLMRAFLDTLPPPSAPAAIVTARDVSSPRPVSQSFAVHSGHYCHLCIPSPGGLATLELGEPSPRLRGRPGPPNRGLPSGSSLQRDLSLPHVPSVFWNPVAVPWDLPLQRTTLIKMVMMKSLLPEDGMCAVNTAYPCHSQGVTAGHKSP